MRGGGACGKACERESGRDGVRELVRGGDMKVGRSSGSISTRGPSNASLPFSGTPMTTPSSCLKSSGSSASPSLRPNVPATGLAPWLLLLLEERLVNVWDLVWLLPDVSRVREGVGGEGGAVARLGKLGLADGGSDLGVLSGCRSIDAGDAEDDDGTGLLGWTGESCIRVQQLDQRAR